MWILPSRSRPHNVERFFAQEIATPGILCVDRDDPLLDAYKALKLPSNWLIGISPRARLADIYNGAYHAHPNREWYGVLADDVIPESKNWDRQLVDAAMPDGMAFGDDGINGPIHATHFVLSGNLGRAVGWLALPGLGRVYIDTVWNDIARSYDVRRYLPGVKLTHKHFSCGAPMDKTYRKANKDRDRAIYLAWKGTR